MKNIIIIIFSLLSCQLYAGDHDLKITTGLNSLNETLWKFNDISDLDIDIDARITVKYPAVRTTSVKVFCELRTVKEGVEFHLKLLEESDVFKRYEITTQVTEIQKSNRFIHDSCGEVYKPTRRVTSTSDTILLIVNNRLIYRYDEETLFVFELTHSEHKIEKHEIQS